MKPRHDLSERALAQICGVLSRFPEVEEAVLFGSRAKATHKPGSDIDLALTGPDLDWRILGRIYDSLDDLLLPYRFSLILLDGNTDAAVAAHIARVGIPIYRSAHVVR
ncbi:MAG: nucleotidyltransferase domain-containing protein [Opitutae bacterium]|nr:nucleotidyltransferase domain-containing protein [Opitutae bacterium]